MDKKKKVELNEINVKNEQKKAAAEMRKIQAEQKKVRDKVIASIKDMEKLADLWCKFIDGLDKDHTTDPMFANAFQAYNKLHQDYLNQKLIPINVETYRGILKDPVNKIQGV